MRGVTVVLSVLSLLQPAMGDAILGVDFNSNQTGGYSPTLSGFLAFNVPRSLTNPVSLTQLYSTSPETTSGTTSVKVSTSSTLDSRDRTTPVNSGSFTYGSLYRDFVVAVNNNDVLFLQIGGLTPNRRYDVLFYAYDSLVATLGSSTSTFTNNTSAPKPVPSSRTITYNSSVTSNAQFSATLVAQTSATGDLAFSAANTGFQLVTPLNAFSIAADPFFIPGDTDGNGIVEMDDYARVARGFAEHLTGWINGDFNGDGTINDQDYLIIDNTFAQSSGSMPASLLTSRRADFGEGYLADLTAMVPEADRAWIFGAIAVLSTFDIRRQRGIVNGRDGQRQGSIST
jgi:hypothetical protein